ncbi:MAG TPA: bacillithiol biosynthesis cysteine-adding enzyme BshC [Acidobacteriota bacterium]|nr:bacillithiol biosynthesis cysteine-adding enzyme BshC [Acidobacteriota bacterium]
MPGCPDALIGLTAGSRAKAMRRGITRFGPDPDLTPDGFSESRLERKGMATDIPFSGIPDQSRLFLSYLDLSPDALRFFNVPPSMDSLTAFARSGISGLRFPRKEIASILRRQNEEFGGDDMTFAAIDELEKPDSAAVLTGQQTGIFSGPAYTIYKALTAVNLAGELKKNGIRAVPVFWMETEDHDLQEAVRRAVPDISPAAETLDYGKILFHDEEPFRKPVGSLRFRETIQTVIDDYFGRLPESKWKAALRSQVASVCKPGVTLAASFARLMHQLLRGTGMIFFDPADPASKQPAAGVFRTALNDARALYEALARRGRELEAAGFHVQAQTRRKSALLFIIFEGTRHPIVRSGAGFRIKPDGGFYSMNELFDRAEMLSPNVLLRPIVQDHLFPTVAYVGGAAEIAYFAQAETLYRHFTRPMPVIWPRNSFTLIDQQTAAEMERLGLEATDCLRKECSCGGNTVKNRAAISAACRPNGNLQERETGILYFISRHGPSIIDRIRSETAPGIFAHRVLLLSDTGKTSPEAAGEDVTQEKPLS